MWNIYQEIARRNEEKAARRQLTRKIFKENGINSQKDLVPGVAFRTKYCAVVITNTYSNACDGRKMIKSTSYHDNGTVRHNDTQASNIFNRHIERMLEGDEKAIYTIQ